MDKPPFTHNMEGLVAGEIDYNVPYEFTFVYHDNVRHTFKNLVKFISMKTGCYVLVDTEGTIYNTGGEAEESILLDYILPNGNQGRQPFCLIYSCPL